MAKPSSSHSLCLLLEDSGICSLAMFGGTPTTEQCESCSMQVLKQKPIDKAHSFLNAQISMAREGKIPDAAAGHRLTVCSGLSDGSRVSDACPRYDAKNDLCGACGCPDWKLAKMQIKVWYPADICPLKRFSIIAGRKKKAPKQDDLAIGLERKSQ